MRRVCTFLFASLFVVSAAAVPGCSCSPPPGGKGGAAAPAAVVPGGGVRRAPAERYAVGTPPPTVPPMAYKDEKSGVLFHFERDGQHVSAVEPDGTVRWHVNPIDVARLKGREWEGKRVWPVIIYAGPPLEWQLKAASNLGKSGEYIGIAISTKEFGLIDVKTGEFVSVGND